MNEKRCIFLRRTDGYLVTGMMDGSVLAWQARDEEAPPRQVLKIEAHKGAVSALAFPAKVEYVLVAFLHPAAIIWAPRIFQISLRPYVMGYVFAQIPVTELVSATLFIAVCAYGGVSAR